MRRALLLTVLVVATTAAPAASEPQAAAGTLKFKAAFVAASEILPCPANVPPEAVECRARTGQALVQGLGNVSEAYTWSFAMGPPNCPANLAKPLATPGRLVVAGKGEITFTLEPGARCVEVEPVRNEPQAFTISGGTGPFAAASGRGTVERSLAGGAGIETWTGAVEVLGFEFDLTRPKLSGATAKTVRVAKKAKTALVTYNVKATDDVDGSVPTSCQPRSGSRFKARRATRAATPARPPSPSP
jgi:hypothetical protein